MKLPFLSQIRRKSPPESKEELKAYDADESLSRLSDDQSVRGLSDLYSPQKSDQAHVRDVADVLLDMGKITQQQHSQLRQEQFVKPGTDAANWLSQGGIASADDILMAKAEQCGLEFRRIGPEDVQKSAFEKLNIDFIERTSIVPVASEQDTLLIATSEPANVFAIEDVKRQTQMNVRIVVCPEQDIKKACEALQDQERIDYNFDDIISDMTEVEVVQDHEDNSEDLEKMAGQSPVIKLVNYLISNAIHEGASDIHIEPKEKFTRIRYRIDGMLFEAKQAPLKMHPAIVSRIKIMSNLDISERRLPQDGKVSAIVGGRAIDLRISTLPTNQGEKTVMRILDSRSIMRGLEQLGMEAGICEAFGEQIALPHGIFLVTGPTGSGKSTTLYSALSQMNGDRLNISTVEDPVEYELDFCNQVQTNDRIGLTFASALRSLLRQDPDVIMIGEIRDSETARIAVQAALTGHLVLSTLHTNDAASSVTRLVNIGVDTYLIAASLNGVLAQRLVRKICPKCKEAFSATEHIRKYVEKAGLNPEELLHGAGCDYCRGSGYIGRTGIYELLIIDDRFRDVINKDSSVASMRRVFRESGRPSLFDEGINKIKQGVTTIEEVLRVTEVHGQNEEGAFVENTV